MEPRKIVAFWDQHWCSITSKCFLIAFQHLVSFFFFFLSGAILKFDIQKWKQWHFPEENYLNYTKKTQFKIGQLHFSQNEEKHEQQWTHFAPLIKCLWRMMLMKENKFCQFSFWLECTLHKSVVVNFHPWCK